MATTVGNLNVLKTILSARKGCFVPPEINHDFWPSPEVARLASKNVKILRIDHSDERR
jgi:hypothetical protein